METCAFCGTPINPGRIYCDTCGKFTNPTVEAAVKSVAADVAANGQAAEPAYRALAARLPDDAIQHLKARVRDHAKRYKATASTPQAAPPPGALRRIGTNPGGTPPPMEPTSTVPPSAGKGNQRPPAPTPGFAPLPKAPAFDLSEFEAETQPTPVVSAEYRPVANRLDSLLPPLPVVPLPEPSRSAENANPKAKNTPAPSKRGTKAGLRFQNVTFNHHEKYDQRKKLVTRKLNGLKVVVTGPLEGAGRAIKERAATIRANQTVASLLAAFLTVVILIVLTIGADLLITPILSGSMFAEFAPILVFFWFFTTIILSVPIYRMLRGQRTVIDQDRVTFLEQLLESLRNEAPHLEITADLSSTQNAATLKRKHVNSRKRNVHVYRDAWLNIRGQVAGGSYLYINVIERNKVHLACYGIGSVSKTAKLKPAKTQRKYHVQVALQPNLNYAEVLPISRMESTLPNTNYPILEASADDKRVMVVVQVPHPPTAKAVGEVLHYVQGHIRAW